MWVTKNSLAKRIEHKNKQMFEKVLTNKNKRSIIIVNKIQISEQEKRPAQHHTNGLAHL